MPGGSNGSLAISVALVVAVLLVACGTGVADTIDTARQFTRDVATGAASEPTAAPRTPMTINRGVSADVLRILETLDDLVVAERGSAVKYDRKDWRHWVDDDRDCQNARAEVLIEESRSPVSFATAERCRVTAGAWLGPWSGELFADASDVDIDHHVPLGHAHISGGWRWDAGRKREYANDLTNPPSLQVTSASVNRTKGKKPPDAWRPSNRAAWCRYAADWIDVKSRWQLTVTPAETAALRNMLDTCDRADSWGLSRPPAP